MIIMSGSGRVCAISSCKNCQKKLKVWNLSSCEIHKEIRKECPCLIPYALHPFPKEENARMNWINVTGRKDFKPTKHSRICSDHFEDGMPTAKFPHPTKHLGLRENRHIQNRGKIMKSPEKSKVFKERSLNEVNHNCGKSLSQTTERHLPDKDLELHEVELPEVEFNKAAESSQRSLMEKSFRTTTEFENLDSNNLKKTMEDSYTQFDILNTSSDVATQNVPSVHNVATQWEDLDANSDHSYCKMEETRSFGVQVSFPLVSYESMTNSECIFYTGLQLEIFLNLLAFLANHVSHLPFKMERGNQFLIVMMRLRLGLLLEDLGRRFMVSTSLISNILQSWLPIMAEKMKKLVYWLPRETIRACLPECFKEFYPNTTCIIDCSEVFINRHSLLRARAETYSNYKGHNTIKFLVGIAPNGHFMFISKSYGGRSSDKFIFNDSKIIKYMLPGDEVLADRGFAISDELIMKQVKLNIPASTRKKGQLTEKDVVDTRRIANVRIHVERAIKKLKEYRILKYELNLSKLSKNVDNLLIICAALCNLKPPLIRYKPRFNDSELQ